MTAKRYIGPVASATLAFALAGCSHETISCQTNADCLQGSIPGECRPSPVEDSVENWCAFPDSSCAGGYRWGILSGDGIASACLAGEPDAGVPDAAPPPDAGRLSTRIFIDDGNSGVFVFNADDLQPLGTITLPPLDAYNLGLSVTSDTAYMVRRGLDYVVVAIDPATTVVRIGYPKTITVGTPRFVGEDGLYVLGTTGSGQTATNALQLYIGPDYSVLARSWPSSSTALPIPVLSRDGLILVNTDKVVHVLDEQLTEVGVPITFPTTPRVYALSKALNRLAIGDQTSVRVYNLTTRTQVGSTLTFAGVWGAVFDGEKLDVLLSDRTIAAYSVDDATTQIIAPVLRGGGQAVYDGTRNRLVISDSGKVNVLDAATFAHVAGSPVTLPSGGVNVQVF